MKTPSRTSGLGSARASRVDCGASAQLSESNRQVRHLVSEKFAMAGAPSPAREARSLPGTCVRHVGKFAISAVVLLFLGCETGNYVPPVTPQMSATPHGKRRTDLSTLEHGRTLFVHRCIECHTLPPIWKYSNDDWPRVVDDMSHRASLKPEERDAVVAYILAARASER